MGTNCTPLLADLFLYSYEAEFIQTLIKSGKRHLDKSFCSTYRYIDDVLSINNPKFWRLHQYHISYIYTTDHHASYSDLLLKYDNFHRLQVKLYDKRDDVDIDIVNFPFLCSNIPQSPACGGFPAGIGTLIQHRDWILTSGDMKTTLISDRYMYAISIRQKTNVHSTLYFIGDI